MSCQSEEMVALIARVDALEDALHHMQLRDGDTEDEELLDEFPEQSQVCSDLSSSSIQGTSILTPITSSIISSTISGPTQYMTQTTQEGHQLHSVMANGLRSIRPGVLLVRK